MSPVSPIVPVLHSFEWDAKRGRIVGLRFQMSDGTERTVGAAVVEIDPARDGAEAPRLVDVRV